MTRQVVLATTALSEGGVWRHISDLAQGLADRGRAVTVALDEAARGPKSRASELGLRTCGLGDVPRDGSILHVHLANTFDTRAARLMLGHRRHGPVVVTEHLPRTNASDPTLLPGGRTPGATAAKDLFKRAEYRVAQHVIAVGGSSGAFMRRWAPRPDRVSVVRNGLPPGRHDELPLPPLDDLHLVTIGTLNVQKGPDVLADALERTRIPWRATLIGEGPQRADVEAHTQLMATGRVRLAGWQDTPAATVASAALVCMPSRWESFPYAALEAGLWGRALLATAVDGLDEIVEPGVTGELVPPDDPASLAAALDRLAGNPATLQRMGACARARVSSRYTLREMVEGTSVVYDRVAAAQ